MRRSGLVAGVLTLVLSASGCWLQPQLDAGNTNFVRGDPELTAATVVGLTELWSTDLTTSELVVGEVMAPVAINQDVYVAGVSFTEPIDAMAAALDLDTGTVRWTTPLDVAASLRADLYDPAWVGGNVLVPYVEADPAITGGGRFSIDAATGVPAAFGVGGGGHLAVADDRVVSQTVTVLRQPPPAVVTTVNWGPFNPVWGPTTAPLRTDYAVVGNRIAWTDDSTGATGYSASCGGGGNTTACLPDWRTVLGGGRVSSPTALGDDRVVYTDTSGTVSVLDMATGAVAWQADLGSLGARTPATVTPEVILVGTSDRRLVALPATGCGAATCAPLWSGTTDQTVTSVVAAGDVAYAATSEGSILAFDLAGCGATTCEPLARVSIGPAVSSPAARSSTTAACSPARPTVALWRSACRADLVSLVASRAPARGAGAYSPSARLTAVASSKQRSEMPPSSWLLMSMTTLFHTLDQLGWWLSFSAARATIVMKPKASTKLRSSTSRWSAPSVIPQPGMSARCCSTSSWVRRAMRPLSTPTDRPATHHPA